jgi:Na+/H+ antiporter NhaD/arsenite permease-like protein
MATTDAQPPARHGVVHMTHPDAHVPGYELPETAAPPFSRGQLIVGFLISIAVAWVSFFIEHATHSVDEAHIALPWVLPFVLLLGCIASMPFIARHWWEHNYHRVAVGLGLIVAAYYSFFVADGRGNIGRSLAEYISFIFLLGSLFVVSGGILIRVRAQATPLANVTLLLIGAIIANVFGTTGASMLLIRPYLRMNKGHVRPYHVVFFIFVVANTGGSLTPIGDPPLFLGYLQGVPFFWVLENCWPIWVMVNSLLLATFYVIDRRAARGGDRAAYDGDDIGPAVSFYGGSNLLFITLILVGILSHATLNQALFHGPWREMLMAAAAFGSLATTPRRVHGENHFNYAPIKEVAYLFLGIFLTMVPALNYLYHQSASLPLKTPGQYYFSSGALSSVLDNAPTYLTFLKTELGALPPALVDRAVTVVKRPGDDTVHPEDVDDLSPVEAAQLRGAVAALVKYHGDRVAAGTLSTSEIRIGYLLGDAKLNLYLVGISMGAVLFGAMTYIGNGPNFMVKSIAEHAGAPTPSFFGYIGAYALPVLLPILVLVWGVFLARGG